jgi:hypothetical protein
MGEGEGGGEEQAVSAAPQHDMHEKHPIEKELKKEAKRLSARYGNAPVVVIVGGSKTANIPRTMTASCIAEQHGRLRDLLGLLQTAIQIESMKHFDML